MSARPRVVPSSTCGSYGRGQPARNRPSRLLGGQPSQRRPRRIDAVRTRPHPSDTAGTSSFPLYGDSALHPRPRWRFGGLTTRLRTDPRHLCRSGIILVRSAPHALTRDHHAGQPTPVGVGLRDRRVGAPRTPCRRTHDRPARPALGGGASPRVRLLCDIVFSAIRRRGLDFLVAWHPEHHPELVTAPWMSGTGWS